MFSRSGLRLCRMPVASSIYLTGLRGAGILVCKLAGVSLVVSLIRPGQLNFGSPARHACGTGDALRYGQCLERALDFVAQTHWERSRSRLNSERFVAIVSCFRMDKCFVRLLSCFQLFLRLFAF